MAVTSMRLVTISGTLRGLDTVLEECTMGGNFQFEQAMSFFTGKTDFTPLNDEDAYTPIYNKLSRALEEANLTPLPQEECEEAHLPETLKEADEYIDGMIERMRGTSGSRLEIIKQIEVMNSDLEHLRQFTDLDVKLGEMFDCEYIKVRFGRLPKESYDRLKYYRDNPYLTMFPCKSDNQFVWGMYVAPVESIVEIDRIFQSLMWERLYLPSATGTPAEECVEMEKRIAALEEEARGVNSELDILWDEEGAKLSNLLYSLSQMKDRFELRRNVARYRSGEVYFLAGWVAHSDCKALKKRLEAISGIEFEFERPDAVEGHTPPVKLKNHRFARPFEFYVNMYGLPAYSEVDPTPFVAVTYFLLFGMMFADVGQGLVLSLIAWFIMWKRMKMELGRIVALCGASSMIFGTLLGSVFGFEHWLDGLWGWVHDKTGIPLNEGKLINIEDSNTVTNLIFATVAIGAVVLVCAMLMNVYSCCKRHMWGSAIFTQNGIAGLVFYCSVAYIALNSLVLGNPMPGTLFFVGMLGVPLIVIMFAEPLTELIEGKEDWFPKSFGNYLMQSFFELFEVILSYVSNTVSFLRIGAFILVHYGMMTVVFTIAEFSPVGSVGYILTMVVGNIIIIALEGLLSGIQALRLEYYEIFSRFYEGTGHAFAPAPPLKRLKPVTQKADTAAAA